VASSAMESNEDIIYSKKSTKLDIIENGDNFLLYSITDKYELEADLNDEATRDDMIELVYQKGKFDLNRSVIEEIQKKEFDNNKFNEMGADNLETISLNSINDHNTFEENSVKILYSLPINSFTLVSDKDNEIYLVKVINSKDNPYSENDDNYLKFVQNQNTENRKNILASYDQLLNNKYNVQLNQKTIDRVKNYFK
jgi:peptidyl-prolyl cis-trans isomerase D